MNHEWTAGIPLAPFALREGEPLRRPPLVQRLTTAHVFPRNDRSLTAPLARSIVPIELARMGDRQVVVQSRFGETEQPLPIDSLVDLPSVISVVADRLVTARRPLPQIRELFVVNDRTTVDQVTLSNLPGLVSLSLGPGWGMRSLGSGALGDAKIDLAVLLDMPQLRHLRFHALAVRSIEPLRALKRLTRLRIEGITREKSVAPLALLTGLRWLTLECWVGLRNLSTLVELEHVDLMDASLADLRAFTAWNKVKSLALSGRGVKSLEGIESLSSLEELFLGGVGARDLDPLEGLAHLHSLTLVSPDRVTDFSPLGRLATLRTLIIRMGSVAATGHLATIGFLAGLKQLQQVEIVGAIIDDGRLDALMDLPGLRRVRLLGDYGHQTADLSRRHPDCVIEVVPLTQAAPADALSVGSIQAVRAQDGLWSIVRDLSDPLGVADNFEASRRLEQAIGRQDRALLARLEFDHDADFVAVYAQDEFDIRRAAEAIQTLIARGHARLDAGR